MTGIASLPAERPEPRAPQALALRDALAEVAEQRVTPRRLGIEPRAGSGRRVPAKLACRAPRGVRTSEAPVGEVVSEALHARPDAAIRAIRRRVDRGSGSRVGGARIRKRDDHGDYRAHFADDPTHGRQ